MKQRTKAELAEECRRLQRENTLLSFAVAILKQKHKPDVREQLRADGGRYVYEVFNVRAPHGGVLLFTYHYPGQRPHTTVHYFDDFDPQLWSLEFRSKYDLLRQRVRELQRAAG